MSVSLSNILAAIALVLSLSLALIEVQRHLHGLRLNITGTTVIDGQANTLYLLLHLTIVNPSTVTKTVYRIDYQPVENLQISEVPGVQDFTKALVKFQPLGPSGRAIQVRLEDTASFPLDVEPHHSKTVFLAIALSPVSSLQSPTLQTPSWKTFGHLMAFDYRNKCLAAVVLQGPL